jgi:hypothetical protein
VAPRRRPSTDRPNTFRYVDELRSDTSVALVLQAQLGESFLEGVDYLKLDDQGRVSGAGGAAMTEMHQWQPSACILCECRSRVGTSSGSAATAPTPSRTATPATRPCGRTGVAVNELTSAGWRDPFSGVPPRGSRSLPRRRRAEPPVARSWREWP